ncbi:MAG: hypothetical protein L6R35_005614, partial [Caloplaca aegaea]
MTQSKEDEAAKERIIKHMNSDHQDSLVRYLEHYCHLSSFSARNAKLNNATLNSLSISTGRGKLHLVPIQPAMAAWSEVRTRLAELDTQAVQGLGRSNITVKKYTRPTGFMAVRSTHASDQPSKFPFTKPIRKIVEPPIVAEMRKLHLVTFKQSTAAGAGAEHSHLLYPPGLDINNQNNLGSSITGNPFRDIFYNPPIGSENETNPATPKVQHPSSNTPQNSEPHPNPIIHRISTFTLPYMKLSFGQQAQKEISPTLQQQQQRPSFSTSTARPDADATTSSPEPLDIDRYHRLADTYIDALVAKLEEIQEERDEVDCEYS